MPFLATRSARLINSLHPPACLTVVLLVLFILSCLADTIRGSSYMALPTPHVYYFGHRTETCSARQANILLSQDGLLMITTVLYITGDEVRHLSKLFYCSKLCLLRPKWRLCSDGGRRVPPRVEEPRQPQASRWRRSADQQRILATIPPRNTIPDDTRNIR